MITAVAVIVLLSALGGAVVGGIRGSHLIHLIPAVHTIVLAPPADEVDDESDPLALGPLAGLVIGSLLGTAVGGTYYAVSRLRDRRDG